MLNQDNHKEVVAMKVADERVNLLFQNLTNSVQEDDSRYKVFVDYLRKKPRLHEDIVEILDEEYSKRK